MACSCGGNRFVARQICRHDVVVDDNNDFLVKWGEGDQDIYDSEDPFGPYTCLKCEKVWDDLPSYKVNRMKQVEMAVLRLDHTWDTLTMLVPEEEFTKIEAESEGDSFWFASLTRDRFTQLAMKLLKPNVSVARLDIYHIDDEWQDSTLEGGEPCLL